MRLRPGTAALSLWSSSFSGWVYRDRAKREEISLLQEARANTFIYPFKNFDPAALHAGVLIETSDDDDDGDDDDDDDGSKHSESIARNPRTSAVPVSVPTPIHASTNCPVPQVSPGLCQDNTQSVSGHQNLHGARPSTAHSHARETLTSTSGATSCCATHVFSCSTSLRL